RARPKPKRPTATSPASRPTPPSAASPAAQFVEKKPDGQKVLVAGDFVGTGLAEGLEVAFASDSDYQIITRINGSSGFVRNDHFDWPKNIGKIVDEEKPAAIVVMIGSNDRQAITEKGLSLPPRSPEWNEEYQ